ncbi:hypothetical protein V8F20_001247 [Naviculisporaceae sp. PSN 640]
MHLSAAAAAAIVLMAGSAFATPAAVPAKVILGDVLSEAESAAVEAKLAAAGVTADDTSSVFSAGDADAEGALGKRSYLGTCNECSMQTVNGQIALQCHCLPKSGARKWSTLPLNRCLVNRNGQLAWLADGGFQGSCEGYLFQDFRYFQSRCLNNAKVRNWSYQKDLEERIHNYNGILGCDVPI